MFLFSICTEGTHKRWEAKYGKNMGNINTPSLNIWQLVKTNVKDEVEEKSNRNSKKPTFTPEDYPLCTPEKDKILGEEDTD